MIAECIPPPTWKLDITDPLALQPEEIKQFLALAGFAGTIETFYHNEEASFGGFRGWKSHSCAETVVLLNSDFHFCMVVSTVQGELLLVIHTHGRRTWSGVKMVNWREARLRTMRDVVPLS
jgi:hypothetical protein